MNSLTAHDHDVAAAFEQYRTWCEVRDGGAPLLPSGLAALARHSVTTGPGADFVETLASRLAGISPAAPVSHRFALPRPSWALIGAVVAIAAISSIATGLLPWTGGEGPEPANAAALIVGAQQAMDGIAAQSPESFTLTVRHTMWASVLQADGTPQEKVLHRVELRRWVQQPDRWRSELWFFSFDDHGNLSSEELRQVLVGNGTMLFTFDQGNVELRPQDGEDKVNTSLTLGSLTDMMSGQSLDEILARAGKCREPEVAGTEIINGRLAHIVDLGPDSCAPTKEPGVHRYASSRVWIDAESLLAVRWLSRSDAPNTWVVSEIADLDLAADIPADTFHFEPPGP